MIRRLLAVCLPLVILPSGCSPEPLPTDRMRVAPEVGCVAPPLTGADMDGKEIDLADYRGKVVVVDFWATWCKHCVEGIEQEKELVQRLQGRPFVFLAVSADHTPEKLRTFLEKNRLPWPTIYDGAAGPRATKWDIEGFPTFFIIDARGVIRYRFDGAGRTLDEPVARLLQEIERN